MLFRNSQTVRTFPQCISTGGSGFRCRENIQPIIWRRRAEKGREIDHDFSGEFDRARCIVHGLISIIALNEGILGECFSPNPRHSKTVAFRYRRFGIKREWESAYTDLELLAFDVC